MPKHERTEGEKRFCKNCGDKFTRKTYQQEFCCGNCRKEFWRHGGVSLRRVFEYVDERIERRFVDLVKQSGLTAKVQM